MIHQLDQHRAETKASTLSWLKQIWADNPFSHQARLIRLYEEFSGKGGFFLIAEVLLHETLLGQVRSVSYDRLWATQNRLIQMERDLILKQRLKAAGPPKHELSYIEFRAQLHLLDGNARIFIERLESYLIQLFNSILHKPGWYLFSHEKISQHPQAYMIAQENILNFETRIMMRRSTEQLIDDAYYAKNILATNVELTASNLASMHQYVDYMLSLLEAGMQSPAADIYDKLTHLLYLIDERTALA